MMREYHVRICEGLGVKFPGPTRQERRFRISTARPVYLRLRKELRQRSEPTLRVSCVGLRMSALAAANIRRHWFPAYVGHGMRECSDYGVT
jgi:hypothetical protein